MIQTLWVFEWNQGGYNQMYADSKEEALAKIAAAAFPTCGLTVKLSTMRPLRTTREQSAYWRNLPLMERNLPLMD